MSDDMLDGLTPTQYLLVEVLVARHRLGEPFWPIPNRLKPVLRALQAAGVVSYEADVMPGVQRAQLTALGRERHMSRPYVSPDRERGDHYRDALTAIAVSEPSDDQWQARTLVQVARDALKEGSDRG